MYSVFKLASAEHRGKSIMIYPLQISLSSPFFLDVNASCFIWSIKLQAKSCTVNVIYIKIILNADKAQVNFIKLSVVGCL